VIFRYFLKIYDATIPLKWWVIVLKFWTWTGYCPNSTGSSVTSGPCDEWIMAQKFMEASKLKENSNAKQRKSFFLLKKMIRKR
jgi:hypothetical protein